MLAENFELVHHLTEDLGDEETEKTVAETCTKLKTTITNLEEVKYVTPREIRIAVKNTKSKKAPGQDGIQNIVLKNLPHKAFMLLTNIFNASLKLSHFPTPWKSAEVLAFPKPGKDKIFPQNYRPISLLPTLSKIFERVILNRIHEFEKNNNNLNQEQFGFRKGRSTVQQLARITNVISNGLNQNKSTAMLLLDIEKAFDTVWHEGLVHKLSTYKLPNYVLKIIMSYLEDRTFQIKIGNTYSKTQNVAAGVPQGSILGPILFLYYINDIPKSPNTNIALFADDTAIMAQSWKKDQAIKYIQRHIVELEVFYHKWKVKINVLKTELLVFSQKEKKNNTHIVYMNEIPVNSKEDAKYLGVDLDKKLTFNKHIKKVKSKAHAIISLLYNLINQKSKMSEKNKILLYKMLI